MGERTGLSLVDELVLATLADVGARSDRPHMKCASVVQEAGVRHRLAPDHAYEALVRLGRDDLVCIPLVDGHGNFGSLDWPPAAPRYTEARLRSAGALAVASDRHELPPLPFDLLNGTMHEGGDQPAFAGTAVLAAVEAAAGGADDDAVVAALGGPVFPTGCLVEGDVAALHAGHHVTLRCSARLTVEDDRVAITELPPGVAPNALLESLARGVALHRSGRLDDHPRLRGKTVVPARGVNDLSQGRRAKVEVVPAAGVPADDLLEPLRSLWHVSHEVTAVLRGPAAALVRRIDPAAIPHLEALLG